MKPLLCCHQGSSVWQGRTTLSQSGRPSCKKGFCCKNAGDLVMLCQERFATDPFEVESFFFSREG